jgi:hypothetical protein
LSTLGTMPVTENAEITRLRGGVFLRAVRTRTACMNDPFNHISARNGLHPAGVEVEATA